MSPIDQPFVAPEREVLTPSLLNRHARELIEDVFHSVWIEGELSNVSRPASGHVYFTLKDAGAQVRGALFKSRTFGMRFKPVDGMQVLVRGKVSLYEARGEFQLIAEHMEPAGEGALQREFDQLKARLAAEGLFDASLKRALPSWPRRIGVITSPSGAAIRDVLSVLARRFALVEVDVLPVPVQGRDAPAAIVAMLQAANAAARHDVLLLTRGGGSLEDLWAFNDEGVARAVRTSAIPVVAAVGHEIDFSIAEFAADLRAATPSAAAELLVPERDALLRQLGDARRSVLRAQGRRIETLAQRVDHLQARLVARHPRNQLLQTRQRLQGLQARLVQISQRRGEQRHARVDHLLARLRGVSPQPRVARMHERLHTLAAHLRALTTSRLARQRAHLHELARGLNAVSPLATLERGYAILLDPKSGSTLRTIDGMRPGDGIKARLVDGSVDLRVLNVSAADTKS
ncbi:MAG: exodeoxyribonuclease VII large subunit [Dokdonella sp.]